MYVCTYVRMYVCMYVCTHVRMYIRMYVCMHVCMCVCVYVCMCMGGYVHGYVYMYTVCMLRVPYRIVTAVDPSRAENIVLARPAGPPKRQGWGGHPDCPARRGTAAR